MMKIEKSKRRILLTRPAAEARLLSGQGQGGDRIFKKAKIIILFTCKVIMKGYNLQYEQEH